MRFNVVLIISWTHVRWLDPNCTYMRFFAICELVTVWQVVKKFFYFFKLLNSCVFNKHILITIFQISELNIFFLKHIFEIPPDHPLCVGRIIFIGLMVAPTIRLVGWFIEHMLLVLWKELRCYISQRTVLCFEVKIHIFTVADNFTHMLLIRDANELELSVGCSGKLMCWISYTSS